jgi:hypothetical protein
VQAEHRHPLQVGRRVPGQFGGPLVDLDDGGRLGVGEKHRVRRQLQERLVLVPGALLGLLRSVEPLFVRAGLDCTTEQASHQFDEQLFFVGELGVACGPGDETDGAVDVAADEDRGAEIAVEAVFPVGRIVGPSLLGHVRQRDRRGRVDRAPTVGGRPVERRPLREKVRVVPDADDDLVGGRPLVAALDVPVVDTEKLPAQRERCPLFLLQG